MMKRGRQLDFMADVEGARRLLIMWVPKSFSGWKRFPWGFRAGRLLVQVTPK